jgi:D-inositol-3-phosphate glycosyltransferase
MARSVRRVALVSLPSSPIAQAGTDEAGSLGVLMLGLAAELAIRDVVVDLVAHGDAASSTVLLPGVNLHLLPPGTSDEFGEGFAQLVRRSPVDVVHAYQASSGVAALPVAIELGIPFVQTFGRTGGSRAEAFLAGQADAIIAASAADAGALIDEIGSPPDRTWIVPPGVDLDLFSPRVVDPEVRRGFGLEPERPVVAMAGRIAPRKGHDLAIEALAELHAMRGWAPLLAIAGGPEAGQAEWARSLELLATDLGVGSDVRMLGPIHRDEVADLLAAASIVLVPSVDEPFGLVALEAAASGTPVVAARTGGLPEAVGPGGLLLGSRDPTEWAAVIGGLLDDESHRVAFGAAGRAHAERFTWGAAAASLLGIYAVLSPGRSRGA